MTGWADRWRRWVRLAACGLGVGLALAAAAWALDRRYPPDLSRLASVGTHVLDRNGKLLALLPAKGGVWRFRTRAEDVSPAFLTLLIRTEDRRFWWHPGVDPVALARASAQMARYGRVVSGGSTLAMQAARLLEPRPRTVRSKLIEMLRALQLEWHYGRSGVLDIWLTLAPYGGNLEGVAAGSQAWFGVGPEALDPAQSALLVALPRRPEGLRPDRHAARAAAVRDRVLAAAGGSGMEAAVPERRQPLPMLAPQVLASLPRAEVVLTTLDAPLQAGLERLVADRLRDLPPAVSIAVVVADARRREIRAVVSGPWRDERRAGDLDLSRAVRSPGSALKPFLYELAFSDGVVRPDTAVTDLPRHFGGYSPENFDRMHAGRVSAAEALRRSLNLPAVALLDRVGPLRFAAWLRSQGAAIRLPPGADPSLPLALGGGGITLRELTGLYAGLVGGGEGALRLLAAGASASEPAPSEAARLVTEVLTQPLPALGPAGVAWKTGTSWGGRDAWAMGVNRATAVGVWVGRADGTPVPNATGRALAVPILSDVFSILPAVPLPPPPRFAMPAVATAAPSLRLLFPPPDSVLAPEGPVVLRAMGGRRPLTFLVNGAPIASEAAKREAGWAPPGPGFYTVTVLDADGLAARAPVRVQMQAQGVATAGRPSETLAR